MDSAPQPIDLARLDNALFDRLYKERIEPCFASNEGDRLAAVAKFKQRLVAGGAVAAIAAFAVFLWLRELTPTMFAGVGALSIAAFYAYQPLARIGRKLKQEYCAAIADAMGAAFTIDAFDPPALPRFKELKLLPDHQRSKFEDKFSGAHRGALYDLYEGCLEQRHTDSKGRTRYSTVFRGQLIRLHFLRDFLGVTIVRRDAGVFNVFGGGKLDGRKLERVGLVSEFEKAFEVWSTDQVEARYLLHPVMMARLIDLEKGLHGRKLRCGFENGDMLIAVEGGNLFEPGDLFKPLVDPARARRIIDEIGGVVKVMDQVLTAQSARPVAAGNSPS